MKNKLGMLLILIGVTGCNSNHLVYVQEVGLGLNVAVGTEGTQKVSIGYDRDVFTIVPRKGESTATEPTAGDAMSLVTVNKARITSLSNMEISEFVAAGDPAKILANEEKALTKLREKIYE